MDVLRAKPGQGRELMVPRDAGRIVTHGLSREPAPRAPHGEDPVVARRRSWFLRLLAGTGVTLVLAVVLGGWLWLPFVALLGVTAGYVALLRQLKLQRDHARRVVHDLDLRREAEAEAAPPAEDEREVAAGGGAVRLRRWDG